MRSALPLLLLLAAPDLARADSPAPAQAQAPAQVELRQVIHFGPNSTELSGADARQLDALAAALRAHPEVTRLRIEGHADGQGSAEYRLALSSRYAEVVKRYLVTHGIEAGRLEVVGYGKERPVADNATEAGRAQNRRVEFSVARP